MAVFDRVAFETDDLIAKLRAEKQRLFDNMVEGDSPQPADVVDSVVYRLQELLPRDDRTRRRLFDEVLNFHPDYSKDT